MKYDTSTSKYRKATPLLLTLLLPLVCAVFILSYQTWITRPTTKTQNHETKLNGHHDDNHPNHTFAALQSHMSSHGTGNNTLGGGGGKGQERSFGISVSTEEQKETTPSPKRSQSTPDRSTNNGSLLEPMNDSTESFTVTETLQPSSLAVNASRNSEHDDHTRGELTSAIFAKHILTTHSSNNPVNNMSSSCHRRCIDFRNKIYFVQKSGEFGAGLIDRLTIFGTLLNMAGFLCARVYVPRPRFLLDIRHNHNQTLDANISWSEFGNFVLWNDPLQLPALIDWDNPLDLDTLPDAESLSQSTSAEHFVVSRKSSKAVIRHFERLEKYVFEQQQQQQHLTTTTTSTQDDDERGFVWAVQALYFSWCDQFARHLEQRPTPQHYLNDDSERLREPSIFAARTFHWGCQYANVGLPFFLREWRDTIVTRLVIPPTPHQSKSFRLVGYFHVRRSDTAEECNTDLTHIESYLNCSLGETVARLSDVSPLKRNIIVLFSSDERDDKYRRQVQQLIEQQQSRSLDTNAISVTAVDLDKLVEITIRQDIDAGHSPAWRLNNFHMFQLILSLGYNQTISQFHMERRRGLDCRACDNVTDQLIKAGAIS